MFPSELVVLLAADRAGRLSKEKLTRPMDIIGKSSFYLYHSLVKRGYLAGSTSSGYRLTEKGKKTILALLASTAWVKEDEVVELSSQEFFAARYNSSRNLG